MARNASVNDLADEVAPLNPKRNTFPAEVLLELAADALELGGIDRAHPIEFTGLREAYLPEICFSGKTAHAKSHYALRAVAQIRAGVNPDLVDDVGWWQVLDVWQWALYALVIYTRAASAHSSTPIQELCRQLANRHGLTLSEPDA